MKEKLRKVGWCGGGGGGGGRGGLCWPVNCGAREGTQAAGFISRSESKSARNKKHLAFTAS